MRFRRVFERSVYVSTGVALITFLLLASLNAVRIGMLDSYLPLVIGFWFLVLGIVAGGVIAGGIQIVSAWTSSAPLLEQISYGCLGLYAVLLMVLNSREVTKELSDIPLRFGLGGMTAGLLALAVMGLLTFLKSDRWIHWCRIGVGLAVLIACLALVPIPTSQSSTINDQLRGQLTDEHFILIGLDGADWDWMKPLMDQGKLPNIQRLYSRGVRANLKTIKPTLSPVLWTTIATGRAPEDHGVTGFKARSILGHSGGITELRTVRGFWTEGLLDLISNTLIPVNSSNRTVPAYWTLASRMGERTVVQNWWVTWPVEPIKGLIVSDRIHFRNFGGIKGFPVEESLTHPEELFGEIAPKMVNPNEITYRQVREFMDVNRQQYHHMMQREWRRHELQSEFKFIYSMFLSNQNIAKYLLRERVKTFSRKPDFMVLFRFPDLISHMALKYSDMAPSNLDTSFLERQKYNEVFRQMYRAVDAAVGKVLENYGSGNVIIVSDHGFTLEQKPDNPEEKWYHHKTTPDGIFLANGPAFDRGDLGTISIYDLFPLLARLKGLPLSHQLEGNVPEAAFSDQFLLETQARKVEEYPTFRRRNFVSGNRATNEEIRRRLKALGYLQ